MTNRRDFLKQFAFSGAVLLSGEAFSAAAFADSRNKVKLRFVVASDGHYGQPKTDFELFHDTLIKQINLFSKNQSVDFCVINGDLIHDEKALLPLVKQKMDGLQVPYFVTKGNHDKVTDEYWNEIWKMPVNHDVDIKNNAILLATTSNEKGEYLSPDLDWLKASLEKSKSKKNCFVFVHIPQAKWTANGIETPEFFELLAKYENIRAVFHGHEHDQDGMKMRNNIPFIFDAHFGGNWGTAYKGFRVVEVMKDNTAITYMMNPTERILEAKI